MKNSIIQYVIKRDGQKVKFNSDKIKTAIQKAFVANGIDNDELFTQITTDVIKALEQEGKSVQEVEHIQDTVEKAIASNGYFDIAKSFILYRDSRTAERKKKERLFQKISSIIKVTDRENANVGNSPSSKLLQISEASDREYAELYLTREEVQEAMKDNLIYPHDYSWMGVGTTTCTFIPLHKLLQNGFNTGHGYIRQPKRIKSATALACIILQSNQNDQHGGQAFGWFDRDLAPYVVKEYEWQVKNLKDNLSSLGITDYDEEKIEKTAWDNTEKETFQAMESLVFNLNSMHSRAGAQVPFSSINMGTDTSKEGRLVTKMLLLAYEKGLGKGEQPLFPNIIFKVKSGINFEPDTPNYDLLMLSLRVTSKRLFPNYVFQDSTLNRDFPEDVPVMGCRTRISWNRHKPANEQTCEGRGNTSFTTVNTVGIALKCKYRLKYNDKTEKAFNDLVSKYQIVIPQVYNDSKLVRKYFVELNKYVDIVIEQLLDRFAYQGMFVKKDFPFLMSGVWMDSDKLNKLDTVADVIKHGTLTIGFIGLAETLTCLVGHHHGEDSNADALGLEIVKFIRKKADEAAETYDLNFSVVATPAEGLCEKLVTIDKAKYGEIKGVTDKAWYTNSFHVPVEYKIGMFKKIEIEGKYHSYCNGGQISYIELKEAPVNNADGLYEILRHMKENDMSYVALNFPVDRCRQCNLTGIIEQNCPACGSSDISRIRRITGYLAELDNFNNGKKQEALHRVSHN
jgi:anaerobic ribonucleoside-triphosphate reductase